MGSHASANSIFHMRMPIRNGISHYAVAISLMKDVTIYVLTQLTILIINVAMPISFVIKIDHNFKYDLQSSQKTASDYLPYF